MPSSSNSEIYVSIYLSISLCSYICMYISCQPQTDCFVEIQSFSVARHAKCFKLGSKPTWLYVSRIFYPRHIVILNLSLGFFTHIFLHTISATGVLNLREELRIYAYVVAGNCIYIYIYMLISVLPLVYLSFVCPAYKTKLYLGVRLQSCRFG